MKTNKLPHKSKSGFKVPDKYFEDLEESLMDGLFPASEEPVPEQEISSGFKTPENYFENFNVELPAQEDSRVVSIFSRRTLYYVAGIAAVLIAVFSGLFVENTAKASWDSLELSAIESYIQEGYLDMPESEITSYLYEDGYVVEDADFKNVDSNAVVDYLDEHVEDPTYIFEQ
ncbi:hypothetical protein RM553_10590 [Zunongwangia sp. F363]|uniref:Uncharacterized protein n=1 Tax=Autumnicola tepida TaxID=3075595 RepID=A0ABU3CAC0_9FLAO|nr:hypothetical protein [Zunongwangia sp. F363]MDT0643276.1 hypothetical protein [Zunongwangia sp. F363]